MIYERKKDKFISVVILPILVLSVIFNVRAEDLIQFNTSLLDIDDQKNFDLDQFSKKGFVYPGKYLLMVQVNGQNTSESEVVYQTPENSEKGSEACLTKEIVDLFALKPSLADKLVWDKNGKCLVIEQLEGLTVEPVLATATLAVGIPQAYLEYSDSNWDPPSRWDNGVKGLLFDYYINARSIERKDSSYSSSENSLSGNGTAGANLGAWRFRADWQMTPDSQASASSISSDLEWNRMYAYRPLPSLEAKLTIGEDYLNSEVFDSFRFIGAKLNTDSRMLPPNLRGYAPEVTGVAKTNARVTISQQGRVLYETQVPSGPFSIQSLSESVSGTLDVQISEADGSVRKFQVKTANIPYLTRPGTVRYTTAVGKVSDSSRSTNGPEFAMGEASWGVSNGWSVFGGGIASDKYQAAAVGIGRDLFVLGAVSFDVTQSKAVLPGQSSLQGKSFRLDYSKSIEELRTDISFAGYRFSEEDFMSMDEFVDARDSGERTGTGGRKEAYDIYVNKQFDDLGLSVYLNYSHQTYWSSPDSDRYTVSASRSFDIGPVKNLSASLSMYRSEYENESDDGMYLSFSVPWSNGGRVSYSVSQNGSDMEQQASFYNRLDDRTTYQISAGHSDDSDSLNANATYLADAVQVYTNISHHSNEYTEMGMTLQGGMTATMEGAALHRTSTAGGTRLMIDTDGVSGVPVKGYGSVVHSNFFGKAVLSDVNNYYRNAARIDLDKLNDKTEVTRSVTELTMTEGAIGYRHFDVISGEKAMATIRLADGSSPPFGATIQNARHQEIGLVGDGGNVYLTGLNSGEVISVLWNGKSQCDITLPKIEVRDASSSLLLPCQPITSA